MSGSEPRKIIGHVVASVKFPLYEGDKIDGKWTWFEYAEPGVTKSGNLGVCTRQCETLEARVELGNTGAA